MENPVGAAILKIAPNAACLYCRGRNPVQAATRPRLIKIRALYKIGLAAMAQDMLPA